MTPEKALKKISAIFATERKVKVKGVRPERRGVMGDWQPIETCPKDGTEILVCVTYSLGGNPPEWETGMWVDSISDEYPWPIYERRIDLFGYPTHWMPLPLPPAEGG